MFFYSWQLALVVLLCFIPLFASLKYLQRAMSAAYGVVRAKVGEMLSAIAEPVVGAQVVRAYAIEKRTQGRIDASIEDYRRTATRAQAITGITFSIGGLAAGLANAGVLTAGVLLGVDGKATLGEILAFMFLVALFSDPVQIATQVLTDAQSAFAGWRRVLGVIATPADVVDPGDSGVKQPRGPITVEFADVDFAYPEGELVLRDVDVQIEPHRRVAVVGETGSGKTTFAKLLTRLMDPTVGRRPAGRGGRAGDLVRVAAGAGRDGAAGRVPVRRVAGGERALRASGRDGRTAARRLRVARPDGLAGVAAGRTGVAGRSARRIAVGGRASTGRPGRGRTSPIPICWSWTRRRRRSTPAPRCGSTRRSNG